MSHRPYLNLNRQHANACVVPRERRRPCGPALCTPYYVSVVHDAKAHSFCDMSELGNPPPGCEMQGGLALSHILFRGEQLMATWRFFSSASGWKWQKLTGDREVLAESINTHSTYDECVRDATSRGYAFVASQDHLSGTPALHTRGQSTYDNIGDAESRD